MDIDKLITSYADWLKSEISFERLGEYYEITTPYLDNQNDYLQIYVKQEGDEVLFTDDGYTIQALKMGGVQFTPHRKQYLERVLLQYGIKLKENELTAKAPLGTFPQKKHLFVQAMLKISDMHTISKSKVSAYFLEDIQNFFQEKDIFYAENVQFTGISGFTHNYDFLLQRTKSKPERLLSAVNSPNKSTVGNILFSWNDTKPSRRSDSELIVILNDRNKIARGMEDAFLNYGSKVIRWSEREKKENVDLLLAS